MSLYITIILHVVFLMKCITKPYPNGEGPTHNYLRTMCAERALRLIVTLILPTEQGTSYHSWRRAVAHTLEYLYLHRIPCYAPQPPPNSEGPYVIWHWLDVSETFTQPKVPPAEALTTKVWSPVRGRV